MPRKKRRFRLLTWHVLTVVLFSCSAEGCAQGEPAYELPAEFQNGRLFVRPVTAEGDTLLFFTDTAGPSLIYSDIVEQTGLETVSTAMNGQPVVAAYLPDFLDEDFIPPPLHTENLIKIRRIENRPPHQRLIRDDNGVLGHAWFAGRTWTINYAEETFLLQSPGEIPGRETGEQIPLGFRDRDDGTREHNFARIRVLIEGESVDLILQSGGVIVLSEKARRTLDKRTNLLNSGFISESVFDRWREDNPDWPVIENADYFYGSDIIQVPSVRIGSIETGPAWFARRRDFAYLEWMSRFTDLPVTGALAVNSFSDLIITIDYLNDRAVFQQIRSPDRQKSSR